MEKKEIEKWLRIALKAICLAGEILMFAGMVYTASLITPETFDSCMSALTVILLMLFFIMHLDHTYDTEYALEEINEQIARIEKKEN